jgi:uncharacterized protein YeaO (DUF488 family)
VKKSTRIRVRRVYDMASATTASAFSWTAYGRAGSARTPRLDEWAKDVAPSAELRVWYRHEPPRFDEFRRRYAAELAVPAKSGALSRLRARAAGGPVTLLTATRELNLSQAAVLAEFLTKE